MFTPSLVLFTFSCDSHPVFFYCLSREHFPFFITAPDGWKNTIRHNLCFSNSFKKTPQQVSGDGKRKSCLWHLTLDGRQRLRDEIHTLTGDSFRMLKRSMNYPGEGRALKQAAFCWSDLTLNVVYHRYDSSVVRAVILLWLLKNEIIRVDGKTCYDLFFFMNLRMSSAFLSLILLFM